jgi:hypothetical protein
LKFASPTSRIKPCDSMIASVHRQRLLARADEVIE